MRWNLLYVSLTVLWISLVWAGQGDSDAAKKAAIAFVSQLLEISPQKKTQEKIQFRVGPTEAEKLRNNGLSWYDLQAAAFEKGIELEFIPDSELLRKSLKSSGETSTDSSTPSSPLLDTFSRSSSPISGEERSSCSLESSSNQPSPFFVRLNRNVSEVTLQLELPSITQNQPLMADLYSYAKERGKAFDSQADLSAMVKDGERYYWAITSMKLEDKESEISEAALAKTLSSLVNSKGKNPEKHEIFAAMLWYFQALSGQKFVLNPETWNFERSFVEGGTLRLEDKDRKLFSFLRYLNSYARISSHYKLQKVSQEWQRGMDMPNGPDILPGKTGTKTVLFGSLTDGQIFLKTEREGLRPTRNLSGSLSHLANWRAHSSKDKLGSIRLESYARREGIHKKVSEVYTDLIKDLQKTGQISPSQTKEYSAKGTQGIQDMIDSLNTLNQELSKAKDGSSKAALLRNMLINFRDYFCMGLSPDGSREKSLIRISGCEALIE